MYEDTLYGGFYTVTGKNRRYIFVTGTDENDNVVTGRVPKEDMVLLSDKISDFIEKVDENEGVLNPEKISDIGKDMIKKQQDLSNFDEYGL